MTYHVRFPPPGSVGDEWFLVDDDEGSHKVHLFDYDAIYARPGLYEQVLEQRLGCRSPELMVVWLAEAVTAAGGSMRELRVLDLGAGNGGVGGHLARHHVERVIGVDVTKGAKRAATRDRPGVYDDYLVVDPSAAPAATWERLTPLAPNSLVTVAALGPGHLPAAQLADYLDQLPPGAWVAFNLRHDFLTADDEQGFAVLTDNLVGAGRLELHLVRRYLHRRSIHGADLHYLAVIGRTAA